MKKIGILCNSIHFSKYAEKVKLAIKENDAEVEVLFSDKLSINNIKEFDFDLIYSRLSGLKWTYEILSQIAINKIPIIPNFEYFRNSQNKYLASVIAERIGIKTPKTYLISTHPQFFQENLELIRDIDYPFILKPLYSSLTGNFCFKIDNREDLKQRREDLFRCHREGMDLIGIYDYALIQELITYQKLVRSLVIDGNTIVSGYALPKRNWKCSVCLNPDIQLYKKEKGKGLEHINKKVYNAFRGEIMIVDIFETKNGYVFNECNTACGLFNLEQISGINCAKIIANYLIEKLKMCKKQVLNR
ncbi:MAG: ATP-grasp domain-containing protein [Candidatus Helarchaeota archaeon]